MNVELFPFWADEIAITDYPGPTMAIYAACVVTAFWRCRHAKWEAVTFAFLLTRCAICLPYFADMFDGDVSWAITQMSYQLMLGIFPYILVRPRLRAVLVGRVTNIIRLPESTIPGLRSSARRVKDATASTVAALMVLERRRRAASAEAVTDEGGAPLSDFEKLNAKYGTYRRGRQAVTVFDDKGEQRTLWMPPVRQPIGSSPHLWFQLVRTGVFIGFGVYVLMQMPAWLRPVAVAGVAGVGIMSHLSLNPLHWLGL